MIRGRAISKRLVVSNAGGRTTMKVTRIRQVRSYASEAADPVSRPPKKPRLFRRFILYTSVFATGFYGGSAIVALNNDRYHDFFVESLPLGETLIDFLEQNGYDKTLRTPTAKRTVEVGQTAFGTLEGAVSRTFGSGTVPTSQTKVYGQPAPPGSVKEAVEQKKEQAREAAKAAIKKVDASVAEAPAPVKKATEAAIQFSEGVAELVSKAEAALAKTVPEVVAEAKSVKETEEPWTPPPGMQVWTGPPLPLGHSLPPGYVYPPPPKKKKSKKKAKEEVPPLPLVAPSVAAIAGSEPVIAQLAGTIDQLTTFLNKNPSKGNTAAKDVLSTAENDLKQLADRFELIKCEEQKKLGLQLEDQARDYNLKLLELEVSAQDRMDRHEEDWKNRFDEEREHLRELYRRKLETELVTQSEIINERLKEEVIAQGIELQRRWIRDIKVKVEEERGGRLAKLDSLASDVKRLERVTLDNNAYLDENISIHSLWSALRTLTQVVSDAGSRKPFREELRTLHSVATNRGDSLVLAALETIESSDIPDIGVDPLQDLITWFSSSVAPKIESVALVPDQNAGVLSHVASAVLAKFRFKRTGLVEGSDVPSVLARAEFYLTQKDLDSATRELNQLTGWPKLLASDWLSAARKRLEVTQALEIIQTHATLSSLLVLDTKQ